MSKVTMNESFANEHAGLRKRLRDLLDVRDPAALGAEFRALRAVLESHFAGEEQAGGLFSALVASGGATEATVESLRASHAEIRTTLAEVAALLESPGLAVPLPVLQALVSTVAEHEKRENALLQEHLERDIGSGD